MVSGKDIIIDAGRPFAVALTGAEGWGALTPAVDFRHIHRVR